MMKIQGLALLSPMMILIRTPILILIQSYLFERSSASVLVSSPTEIGIGIDEKAMVEMMMV